MTGSLQVKNDKFYIVLNLIENGKRKQKWIATGLDVKGNKRRAEKLLRDTPTQYEVAPPAPKCDTLLADYIRDWLKIARRKVAELTYQGYEQSANGQVIPYFEERKTKLSDVTVKLLQAYFDEKAEHGRRDGGGGVSPASVQEYSQPDAERGGQGGADTLKPLRVGGASQNGTL